MMNDITKFVSFLLNTQACSLMAWPAFPITVAFSGALWELRKQTGPMAESTNPPVYENKKYGDNRN